MPTQVFVSDVDLIVTRLITLPNLLRVCTRIQSDIVISDMPLNNGGLDDELLFNDEIQDGGDDDELQSYPNIENSI